MSSTIDTLKQLIQLEQKRADLQQQLAALDSQLNSLKQGLAGGASSAMSVKPKGKPGRPPGSKNVATSVPRKTISAAARARMVAGAKARWAKIKATKPAPVAKPVAPAAKAPAKPAVAPKASAKPSGKTAKGFQRGALADSIKAALKEAGAKGASIKDLAAKLKSEYRNIQVWFATTGKKHKEIKKIAPATYRLK